MQHYSHRIFRRCCHHGLSFLRALCASAPDSGGAGPLSCDLLHLSTITADHQILRPVPELSAPSGSFGTAEVPLGALQPISGQKCIGILEPVSKSLILRRYVSTGYSPAVKMRSEIVTGGLRRGTDATMTTVYRYYQRHSILCPPDWRWQRAQNLVSRGRYFSRRRDDELTGQAMHYLQLLRRRPARAKRLFSDIDAAKAWHTAGGPMVVQLQARLLAAQTPNEIACILGVTAEQGFVYEQLFYNVRDRLTARDWILVNAIRSPPFIARVGPDPAATLRAFGFDGGPVILDRVVPYLVDGKDLFAPDLDLSTKAGREEQAVRLAVVSELMPLDEWTSMRCQRLMVMLREWDQRRSVLRSAAASFEDKLELQLGHLSCKAAFRSTEFDQRTTLRTAAGPLRECA